ncbi:ABC transporter permease [Actinokineospora sp.]|uniref:ABC transporter permease n=1 Tax=Actinokineospora sp. TaxID=1872133 RepID=UPI003D6A0B84
MTTGVGIAIDREDGTLKRLRGTPITATAYFVGKIVLVAVATLGEVILLLAVGVLLFDLQLPTDPARWLTLAWLLALSVLSCTLIGIAASSHVRQERARGAEPAGDRAAVHLRHLRAHTALVLGAWCVIGLVLCLLTFRWSGRRAG